ncbi:MAG TPA: ribonuclease PH [Acidimicrobiia bacterium]|nr:ribonuclease PH [Acidimicrobiia bacterium]
MRARPADELRPVRMHLGYTDMTPGSVLIEMGRTRVLCTAAIESEVPRWMRDTGKGWVTAEYGMLPGSSSERIGRDQYQRGRALEISRLVGRALRSVVDLKAMGECMVRVDCDVLQADGGTRTAAITGAWVALHDALADGVERGVLARNPIVDQVAAVSVGIVEGAHLLDLEYDDDVNAEVDMNVVMSGRGLLVEVQGTAEGAPFSRQDLDQLLDLATGGIKELVDIQRQATEPAVP